MTSLHPAIILYWAVAVGLVVVGGYLVGDASTAAIVGAGAAMVGGFGVGFAIGVDAVDGKEVDCA